MAKTQITMEQILQAEEFTRVYQENKEEDISIREAKCLKVQYPATLLPIREQDLIAGRVQFGLVGFASKDEDGFGYCCHVNDMEGFLQEEGNEEEKKRINELLSYWRTERNRYKTRKAFSAEMENALPYDDLEVPGVGFPLYRMAGWVLDYSKLMELGIPGLKQEVRERKTAACHKGNREAENLFLGMELSLEVLCSCAQHYITQIIEIESRIDLSDTRRSELIRMKESLQAIQVSPPRSMHEALQLMWLYSLISVTMDYGRMDDYMGTFYVNDIKDGRLTPKEALDILKSQWTLIADTAEAVHGRVMLGGKGRAHEEEADQFAVLVMEASKLIIRHLPQLSLRLYEGCNPGLMEKALDVLGAGRTYPILYNDDVNIPSVMKVFGVEEDEARDYYPFGCGEFVLGTKSFGSPNGLINVLKALELAMLNGVDYISNRQLGPATGEGWDFKEFEELYQAFLKQCEYFVYYLAKQQELEYQIAGSEASYLMQSMLYDDCLEKGKGLFSGGIRYLGGTLESYGNISTSDSLYAIKKMVYDTRQVTMKELITAIKADFAGYEGLWKLLRQVPKFGNDIEGPDEMAARMHEDICRIITQQGKKTRLSSYLMVLINNDHNVKLGSAMGASPDGRKKGRPMSNANGPTSGNDTQGITALLNSMIKLRTDIHAGSVQNMKFSKDMFQNNRLTVKSLLDTYFRKGGSQAMITVVDRNELQSALKEPDKYQNLFVRVGGYSGRFIHLPKDVQTDILNRTLYE